MLPRVKAAGHAIELVAYGAAKERYDYSVEDAEALDRYLRTRLDKAMESFGIRAKQPSEMQGISGDTIMRTVEAALASAFAEAEQEIETTRQRALIEIEQRAEAVRQLAAEQARVAAGLMAEVEEKAILEQRQLLEGQVELSRQTHHSVFNKARERVLATVASAVPASASARKSELEELLQLE